MTLPTISLRLAIRKAQTTLPPPERFRVVWDDENPDWNYKCRTQFPGSTIKPDNPPAVMRFFNEPREKSGDYRVNMEGWRNAIIALNGGDVQKFDFLVGPARATYNTTGWPQQAYITFSGNELRGEYVGNFFRFETLKPSDVGRVAGMTIQTHPHVVQRFTCVTWDSVNKVTKHIEHTGTPRGDVHFFLVTKEGFAFMPKRHVVRI